MGTKIATHKLRAANEKTAFTMLHEQRFRIINKLGGLVARLQTETTTSDGLSEWSDVKAALAVLQRDSDAHFTHIDTETVSERQKAGKNHCARSGSRVL